MPNALGRRGGADRDVGELLGGRVGVDGAVAVHVDPVGHAHEERADDDGDARAGLDELQARGGSCSPSC
jgi:hypothetical protein